MEATRKQIEITKEARKEIKAVFSLQNKSFLRLQHVENKGFQTVIKHRLKAFKSPLRTSWETAKKIQKMHISF